MAGFCRAGRFCLRKKGTSRGKRGVFRERRAFRSEAPDGVDDDHGQNDGSDGGIEPIALESEVEEREHHAHDGGENERHDPELDAAMGIECGHTAHDAREAGVVGLCGGCVRIEMAVVGHCICAVRDEIVETAQRGQHASQRDAAAQGHSTSELLRTL